MRSSIYLFEDQYKIAKTLKSNKLIRAFLDFMFEDKEPEWLKVLEQNIFDSFRKRMESSIKKLDGNSKWGQNSHWGWRPWNTSSELSWENKLKTTQKQEKNNEVEDISISIKEKEIYKEKEKQKKQTTQTNLDEYYKAYESSSLRNWIWDDEWSIMEWLQYKQSRKEMYATPNSFMIQLKGYFNLVSPNEILPDVWKRLSFAIHTAIDNKRKWLVWDDKQKQLYEWYRKVDFSLKKKEQWIA